MKRMFSTFVLTVLVSLSMVGTAGAEGKIPQHSGLEDTMAWGCGCIVHALMNGAIKLFMTGVI